MKRLCVGVIGLGVGEQHIAAYQKKSGFEVTTLCDISDDKIAMARTKYPEVKLTKREDDVLLDPEIDVVSIASYDDQHYRQVVKALAAGKHVFVEKPLCRTLEELKAIKDAWQKYKGRVKLGSNLVLRAAPIYEWLRKKVEAGEMGDVYSFDGDYLYGRLEKITQGWRTDVDNYSVMGGGGIHMIDLLLWITHQRPQAVAAAGNRICTQNTRFMFNDYVATTLVFPSGLVGRICANFGSVHPHQHVVRLFGTKGTFILDDRGARWHHSRDHEGKPTPIQEATLPASKGDLIYSFTDAIQDDRNLDQETQMYFDAVSICVASDNSLQSRSFQEVQYV